MVREFTDAEMTKHRRKAKLTFAAINGLLLDAAETPDILRWLGAAVLPSPMLAERAIDELANAFEQAIGWEQIPHLSTSYIPPSRKRESIEQIRQSRLTLDPECRSQVQQALRRELRRLCALHGIAIRRHVAGDVDAVLDLLAFALNSACAFVAQARTPDREYVTVPCPWISEGQTAAVARRFYAKARADEFRARAQPQLAHPSRQQATARAVEAIASRAPPGREPARLLAIAAICQRNHPVELAVMIGVGTDELSVEKARSLMRRVVQPFRNAEFEALCEAGLMTPQIAAWLAVENAVDVEMALRVMRLSKQPMSVQRAFARWASPLAFT